VSSTYGIVYATQQLECAADCGVPITIGEECYGDGTGNYWHGECRPDYVATAEDEVAPRDLEDAELLDRLNGLDFAAKTPTEAGLITELVRRYASLRLIDKMAGSNLGITDKPPEALGLHEVAIYRVAPTANGDNLLGGYWRYFRVPGGWLVSELGHHNRWSYPVLVPDPAATPYYTISGTDPVSFTVQPSTGDVDNSVEGD